MENAQEKAMERLEKQGFKFSNWIVDRTADYGNDEHPGALMVKKSAHGREYREVAFDGSVN